MPTPRLVADDFAVPAGLIYRPLGQLRPPPGAEGPTLNFDIAVTDLDGSVGWALEQGATLSGYQPQDDVRVLLDPAGHPFCLYVG